MKKLAVSCTVMVLLGMSTGCDEGGPVWQDFHSVDLKEVLFPDRPTLIQVTADWCVTCIVNEQETVNSPDALRLYADRGIQLIRVDLTERDPGTAAWLDFEGLDGNLPIYLFFNGEEPVLSPSVPDLTRKVHQSPNLLTLEDLRELTTL